MRKVTTVLNFDDHTLDSPGSSKRLSKRRGLAITVGMSSGKASAICYFVKKWGAVHPRRPSFNVPVPVSKTTKCGHDNSKIGLGLLHNASAKGNPFKNQVGRSYSWYKYSF